MSRRITVFALAATAALIATQAHADRECFENSCRLPEVVEAPEPAPPAEPAPSAAVTAAPTAEDSQAAHQSAQPVQEMLPQEPPARHAVAKPLRPAERAVVEKVAASPEPRRVAPRYPAAVPSPHPLPAVREAVPVRETIPAREALPAREAAADAASSPRPARAPAVARPYAVSEGAGPLIINVPGYGADGVAPVRPYIFYTDSHAPRLYVLAPNAKIIHIDDGDY